MVPVKDIFDKFYKRGSKLRELLLVHSEAVAAKALDIARLRRLDLDPDHIYAGAMLHDVGIFYVDAPGIYCNGSKPYIMHGILGAEMLRAHRQPEWLARVAERHTGSGLTAEDIRTQHLPLPEKDFLPETLLEKLICYADKFFSKTSLDTEKDIDRVRASMKKFGPGAMQRFEDLHALFTSDQQS
ncbi:MAG: HDIG domain-containing protein [Bacteroides sp.]|nr:HDIG domain-containing protein [Bacteroides sp.]